MDLLAPEFLRRLERLALVARKTLRGVGRGERRSKRHGGTVEFADYRGYMPGDDTRQIDWYAYARLESLYLKLYSQEQDLTVHLLLDQSASMGTGSPPKLSYARRVAAALAYVGLAGGDRVSLHVVRGEERGGVFGPSRGRGGLVRLLRFLEADPEATGRTSLQGAVGGFLSRKPAKGLVVVLSDLLDPGGWLLPLQRLRAAGHEVHVIHLVAPDEVEPEVGQDVELEDSETGEVVSVSLTRRAVASYRRAVAELLEQTASACSSSEIGYVRARTDVPFEELVLGALRSGALVR